MLKSMQADNLTQLGLQARSIIVEKFERQAHWQNMLRFYNKQLGRVDLCGMKNKQHEDKV